MYELLIVWARGEEGREGTVYFYLFMCRIGKGEEGGEREIARWRLRLFALLDDREDGCCVCYVLLT